MARGEKEEMVEEEFEEGRINQSGKRKSIDALAGRMIFNKPSWEASWMMNGLPKGFFSSSMSDDCWGSSKGHCESQYQSGEIHCLWALKPILDRVEISADKQSLVGSNLIRNNQWIITNVCFSKTCTGVTVISVFLSCFR